MITSSQFSILDKYSSLIQKWSEGRTVSMNRDMYNDISPILKEHVHYSGSLMCAFCVLEMFRHCYNLYHEYLNSQHNG